MIIVLFILNSCKDKDNPLVPLELPEYKPAKSIIEYFENDYKYNQFPKFIRIKDSTEIPFLSAININFGNVHNKSSKGKINRHGERIYFTAANKEGIETIYFNPLVNYEEGKYDSIHIYVYKQFVILKADDLVQDEKVISKKWQNFINYSIEKKIRTSIGIVGTSLESNNYKYYKYIKDFLKVGLFEIFNHGYYHLVNGDKNGYSEFRNTSYDFQKFSLKRTQDLCQEYLNFRPAAFAAPGNAIDETTLQIINESEDIKIWFFGNPNTSKMNLKRNIDFEYPYGNPQLDEFFNKYKSDEEVITIQIHPNMWDDEKFQKYILLIDFLQSQNVTFITPSEYYFLKSPR